MKLHNRSIDKINQSIYVNETTHGGVFNARQLGNRIDCTLISTAFC